MNGAMGGCTEHAGNHSLPELAPQAHPLLILRGCLPPSLLDGASKSSPNPMHTRRGAFRRQPTCTIQRSMKAVKQQHHHT